MKEEMVGGSTMLEQVSFLTYFKQIKAVWCRDILNRSMHNQKY